MLFYKVLIWFWGCTRTCSHAWWFENRIIFHIIYIITITFLPSLAKTAQLVPGLMKARLLKNEMCCDWLTIPVHCDWRTA